MNHATPVTFAPRAKLATRPNRRGSHAVIVTIGGGTLGAKYGLPEVAKILEEHRTIAANTIGFSWQFFPAAGANDYDEIFARLAAEHFDADPKDPVQQRQPNAHLPAGAALSNPSYFSERPDWAKNGLLLTYGQDSVWSETRAMDYVDKILRGAKPSELPVEQATKLQLIINLTTAKALGLTVPPSLLARADEVIE